MNKSSYFNDILSSQIEILKNKKISYYVIFLFLRFVFSFFFFFWSNLNFFYFSFAKGQKRKKVKSLPKRIKNKAEKKRNTQSNLFFFSVRLLKNKSSFLKALFFHRHQSLNTETEIDIRKYPFLSTHLLNVQNITRLQEKRHRDTNYKYAFCMNFP